VTENTWPYEHTIYEKSAEDHIAIVTMNNPSKLNPMTDNSDLMEGIRAAVSDVNNDNDIKVLIIRGAGPSFSSGGDIGYVGHYYGAAWKTPQSGEKFHLPPIKQRLAHDLLARRGMAYIYDCVKITIAEVHGYCLGGGLDIASACDLVIAAEDAVFGHPYWRFVGPGGDQNLLLYIMQMGLRRTADLMFTGRWFTAAEGQEFGFVNRVVPFDELQEQSRVLASACALTPGDGVVIGKATLALVRDSWGARLGYQLAGIMHTLGGSITYESDEFNLMKERRDIGGSAAIKRLRESYNQVTPEPPVPQSMRRESQQ
jgi:enoyl-CoA hydratase